MLVVGLGTDLSNATVPDPIAVAQIHASIIAIYFGLLTAFAIGTFGTIRAAEDRIIAKAHAINRISFGGVFFQENSGEMTPEERSLKMTRLEALVSATGGSAAERGQEEMEILTKLTNSDPFVPLKWKSDGSRADLWTHRVDFRGTGGVRQWVVELKDAANTLEWFFLLNAERLVSDIRQYARALPKDGELPHLSKEDTMKRVLGHMQSSVRTIAHLAKDIEQDLHTYDSLVRRSVNKGLLLGSLVVGGIAFYAGVVIPITVRNPPVEEYVWIPVYCYGLIFAFLLIGVLLYKVPRMGRHTEVGQEPSR